MAPNGTGAGPRSFLLAGAAAIALAVAGCSTVPTPVVGVPGINADYHAGYVPPDNESYVPSLDEVINKVPSARSSGAPSTEDRLRGSAMHDAAVSYGARAGLAWESRNINKMIMRRSAEISRTYDFQRLLIKGPDNVMILPPVISEAKKTWEAQDAGKTLRVADTAYEIIDQARFTAVPPSWQTYLTRDYKTPDDPPDALLPHDGQERERWAKWVKEGWEAGRAQAQDIFKEDLDRLERDFQGMVRYRALLEENKVSAPVVADAKLGTTGTGQDMRVNDRAVRITKDPTLNVNQPKGFQAAATTPTPDGGTTNPGTSSRGVGDVAPQRNPPPPTAKGGRGEPRHEASRVERRRRVSRASLGDDPGGDETVGTTTSGKAAARASSGFEASASSAKAPRSVAKATKARARGPAMGSVPAGASGEPESF